MEKPTKEAKEIFELFVTPDEVRMALQNPYKNKELMDKMNRVIAILDEKDEPILFLRDEYSEVGGRGCPACHYEDGKFIKLCRLHAEIDAGRELYDQYRTEVKAEFVQYEAKIEELQENLRDTICSYCCSGDHKEFEARFERIKKVYDAVELNFACAVIPDQEDFTPSKYWYLIARIIDVRKQYQIAVGDKVG